MLEGVNLMERLQVSVINSPIDVITESEALQRIALWSSSHESRAVYLCNVHSVVTARHDVTFAKVLSEADIALPDGAPVAWMQRIKGANTQMRISGPDLMWSYCAVAARRGESIYLLGSTPSTLEALQHRLLAAFPDLIISGSFSPPFRPLSEEEDADIIGAINSSGAGTVWVSLGCPKQERWIHAHRGRINAVMLGVGAAFDFHAGTCKHAPEWMRDNGLEWLYRLIQEPRRLWKRYFVTNTLFILYALPEALLVCCKRIR